MGEMFDSQRVNDLMHDIITAGHFQGANMLELAQACHTVMLSCEACIVSNVEWLDSKEFNERMNRIRDIIEGVREVG